ncbi:MAG: transcription initiation factor IIB family protein [Desulfurococcaceae archaeon]
MGGSAIAFVRRTLRFLEQYSNSINLPEQSKSEAKSIAEKSIMLGVATGYKPEEVAAASIYTVCRKNKTPLPIKEVAKLANVDSTKVVRLYRKILTSLGIKVPVSDPETYLVRRIAPILGVGSEILTRALEIIRRVKSKGLIGGKNPGALAAAALYVAALHQRQPVKISKLARVSGVTSVTIRNCVRRLTQLVY